MVGFNSILNIVEMINELDNKSVKIIQVVA